MAEHPTSNDGKISLCMIVGNVETYVERCLKSFAPIADEIVLVRAIGNQTPDDTLVIAEKVCKELGKPLIVGEYKNAQEYSDFHHVDSFCAARQMSFDLASHDWCCWCDSDDVLSSGAEAIREHAASGEFSCYLFKYEIFGRGICLPRERLIRKNSGKWKYAVHECFEFDNPPVKACQDDAVVVTHLPQLEKTGSHDRNLRILGTIPDAEMTTGLLFHLHEELTIAKRIDEAVVVAQKILDRQDLGRPERMDLFLNLASSCKEPDETFQLLLQAYAADPRRRDGLAHLCNHALAYGKPDVALAFARQMLSIPPPPPESTPWNHRDLFYGWLGDDLHARALRACGWVEHAETIRLKAMEKVGYARIALIHATRGRPHQAIAARKLWLEQAAQPERIEHLMVIDADDEASRPLLQYHSMVVPPGGGCVSAWNHGAFKVQAQILVQMSDDWIPPQKWDDLIVERLCDASKAAGKTMTDFPAVLAISDGQRKDNLICMAICTRAYIKHDCFMFHPEFKSMYSDNWFTHLAYERKAVIEARDIVFQHQHPAFGTAKMDATYAATNAVDRYAEGEAIFKRLKEGNDWSSVPGFFDYFMFYDWVADRLKDGDVIAEVGVWLGRSIIYMAKRLKRQGKNVKILAVDWFNGETGIQEHQTVVAAHGGSIRAQFEANLERCGVRDMVTILEGGSADMAKAVEDEELAFCFIDAAHYYDAVSADLKAWIPKVKPDGIIAGHDAQWWEVEKAVKEQLPMANIMGSIWVNMPEAKP